MAARRHRVLSALAGAIAVVGLLVPASALAGAVITPVPTFPYPNVVVGQPFSASITLFNNSTGQEAQAGVTVLGSNLDLYPSCPDSVITANNCPNSEAGVFGLTSPGTSGAGSCPPGNWTITEPVAGRFAFAPPGAIALQPSQSCTINFTAVALRLPQFDSALAVPGIQTNQVASIDATSSVSGIRVRNSGSSTTGVIAPAPAGQQAGAALKVTEGCPRIVKARVTGTDIQRVTFFVDGRKQRTVKRAPFRTRIKAFKLKRGRHKVRANVTFSAASGRLAAAFKGGFLRCAPRRTPSFTG